MDIVKKRFVAPTNLDHQPYKTVWVYLKDHKERNIYVQLAHDPHKPHWVSFGRFLEIAFHNFFDNTEFIDLALGLYMANNHDTFEKLKSILHKAD
jgi:hypothetical protein